LELELNLVPILLKFLYRGTELHKPSSSSSTDFLELELNLVPFKKELSQPWTLNVGQNTNNKKLYLGLSQCCAPPKCNVRKPEKVTFFVDVYVRVELRKMLLNGKEARFLGCCTADS